MIKYLPREKNIYLPNTKNIFQKKIKWHILRVIKRNGYMSVENTYPNGEVRGKRGGGPNPDQHFGCSNTFSAMLPSSENINLDHDNNA